MYVKITSGSVDTFPYSIGQLRRDNPTISFPRQVSNEILAEYGIYSVTVENEPSYNSRTHKVSLSDTPSGSGNTWSLQWTTTAKTTEEVQEYDDELALSHRGKRNQLLADSDWTQMNDSPLTNEVKTAWATYRQELRDLSDLDAWPNLDDADWPVAP